MNPLKAIPIFLFILIALLSKPTHATTFDIQNNCSYTIWAAAMPGGGKQLNPSDTWSILVNSTQRANGRIWARTRCNVTGPDGLKCETGDCGGLLECTANGSPPNTLVEYALNQFNYMDFFDISLLNGFNVPVSFAAKSNKGCNVKISCSSDLNVQCPKELRVPGGCNDPCTAFKTDEYCCYSGSCNPTTYSRYFNLGCPQAVSFLGQDGPQSTDLCPTGTDYAVTFCPWKRGFIRYDV